MSTAGGSTARLNELFVVKGFRKCSNYCLCIPLVITQPPRHQSLSSTPSHLARTPLNLTSCSTSTHSSAMCACAMSPGPQIRIASGSAHLTELAMAFAPPIIIESPLRPGSMRALADDRETPMLLLEAGEALRFDRYSIKVGVAGVLRVLAHIGMIEHHGDVHETDVPVRANRSSWVRAPRGGVTRRVRKSGDIVKKGSLLAVVGGLFGEDGLELVSPFDGVIIGHATLPVVNQGDALFHIAEVETMDAVGKDARRIADAMAVSQPPHPPTTLLDEDEVL